MTMDTHRGSRDMLMLLVSYMKDNAAIQRAIVAEFGWKPSNRQINAARTYHQNQVERFARTRSSKDGSGENDRVIIQAIKAGTEELRRRIVVAHPNIMKTLAARGNTVVWND